MNPNMFHAFLLGVFASVILVISPPHASADEEKCARDDKIYWTYSPVNPPKDASRAPFDVDGKGERTLSDYHGVGLVVNFWATWCIPCVREMPSLDRLQAKVKGDLIRVLAISEDRGGPEKVKKFYAKNDIGNLSVILDKRGKLMRASGVLGLPATLLINPKGKVVGRVIGVAEWDSPEITAFLRRCLGS